MPMSDLTTLGGRLRWARETTKNEETGKPLSEREMSRRAGLSEGMWGLLEGGEKTRPAGTTVEAIADLLGVSTGWVLVRRGDDPDPAAVLASIAQHAPIAPPADERAA